MPIAVLGLSCLAAAAGGGYVAMRQNVVPVPTAAATGPESASIPSQAVRETEAVMPASAPAAAPPAPANATPAPVSASKHAAFPTETVRYSAPVEPSPARHTDPPAPADHTGSNSPAAAPQAPPSAPPVETPPPAPAVDDRAAEPAHAPDTGGKHFEERVVAADSVIGFQSDTSISTEHAKVEDKVEAHVVRDVRVNGEVAIPAGTRALGSVVVVERGGRFKERARLGIRFNTLVMADGTRLPINTETIYRMGDDPTNGSAARVGGGAVVGAIIGGIIGGGKGAAIGATTGAGAGTASVMTSDRREATFPAGVEVTARVLAPVTVTIERE